MKYSLMSHMIDSEIRKTKPTFIHRLILNDLGWEGPDPEADEMFRFFNEHGIPMKNGTMTFEDLVRFAADNGYDGLDLMSYHFDESGDDAKEILEKYGITLAAVNILTDFGNISDDETFEKEFAEVRRLMNKVRDAGGKNILFMPVGYVPAPGVSREQVFQNMVRALKAAVEYGNSIGLTINTETLESPAAPLCSIAEMRRVFEAVPDLKYNHDSGNPVIALEDPLAMYELFRDRLANVHFKDLMFTDSKTMVMDVMGRYLEVAPVGGGMINLREHLRLLKRDDYQGFITIEGTRPAENILDGSVEALKYLRGLEETL